MRRLSLLCLLVCACPPAPVNPGPDADASQVVVVETDAGITMGDGGDLAARACAVLRYVGCPSGGVLADGGDGCEAVMRAAQKPGGFDLKPECIASKSDKAGVLSCGTVRCR